MTEMDGITSIQGEQATGTPEPSQINRKTYPQDWPAYNAAQTSEKDHFHQLLADLCANVAQPEYTGGRPRLPLADMVFAGGGQGILRLLGSSFRLRRAEGAGAGFPGLCAVLQLG